MVHSGASFVIIGLTALEHKTDTLAKFPSPKKWNFLRDSSRTMSNHSTPL